MDYMKQGSICEAPEANEDKASELFRQRIHMQQ